MVPDKVAVNGQFKICERTSFLRLWSLLLCDEDDVTEYYIIFI